MLKYPILFQAVLQEKDDLIVSTDLPRLNNPTLNRSPGWNNYRGQYVPQSNSGPCMCTLFPQRLLIRPFYVGASGARTPGMESRNLFFCSNVPQPISVKASR